jgi:hypothetical protein
MFLVVLSAMLGIQIRRIRMFRMFLGLLEPDPLVRGPDPDLVQNGTDPEHC